MIEQASQTMYNLLNPIADTYRLKIPVGTAYPYIIYTARESNFEYSDDGIANSIFTASIELFCETEFEVLKQVIRNSLETNGYKMVDDLDIQDGESFHNRIQCSKTLYR
jgi:hypothetical protein